MNRGGAVWLQGACLETALALVPLFLGRLCAWGMFPQRPCRRGNSLWLAPVHYVCGRLEGREGGRRLTSWGYYSTSVRILQGGGQGPLTPVVQPSISGGIGLACALLQRRVWLGGRRCPIGPPSNVFRNRGTPPVPPAGAAPPAPRLGGTRVLLWRALLQRGARLACAAIPPAPLGASGPPSTIPSPDYGARDSSRLRRGLRPLRPA